MEYVDTLIIGGGVVGLATAASLCKTQHVVVIEQHPQFGEHTSSRNSEVIHAGIYYRPNSLKATLCIRGKTLLYKHLQQYKIPFQQIGKLIVASNSSEIEKLAQIKLNAEQSGVNDIRFLTQHQMKTYAPQLHISDALFSPSTGILDSHQLMLSFIHIIESAGGHFVVNTQFLNAKPTHTGFCVRLQCANEIFTIHCKHLINCGGLFAQNIANNIEGLNKNTIPPLYYCRGQYYKYQGKHPFKHLVYPTPAEHGLGIHATLDLAGMLKFGPDTQFIPSINYALDNSRFEHFVDAIKQYWPLLDERKLQLDYAGIRPKLQLSGQQDFCIQTHAQHAIEGLVNLYGIESPGLTACLAIAEQIAQLFE